MNQYLPFWMTSYAQRIIAVLVAVIAIVLPVFNYAPKLYLWFIRERVRRLYRRLRVVEQELQTELSFSQVQILQSDLEGIAGRPTFFPNATQTYSLILTGTLRPRARTSPRVLLTCEAPRESCLSLPRRNSRYRRR